MDGCANATLKGLTSTKMVELIVDKTGGVLHISQVMGVKNRKTLKSFFLSKRYQKESYISNQEIIYLQVISLG